MLEIHLRTLTPLWTGGVDQTCDRLHETGLIGSLRWWYEALVRGLCGYACDPTQHGCMFDEERYRKSKAPDERQRLRDAGLCDACQVFGATGWARKFKLQASADHRLLEQDDRPILIPSGRKRQTQKGEQAGGWFLQGSSYWGNISLRLLPLRPLSPFARAGLEASLGLIFRHASLGAKSSNGYGVVVPQNQWSIPDLSALSANPGDRSALPDLRDFFFTKLRFSPPSSSDWWRKIQGIRQAIEGKLDDESSPKPLRMAKDELEEIYGKGVLPIAPAVRDWLRYLWRNNLNSCETHFVFGEASAVCPHCCHKGFREDKDNRSRYSCPDCGKTFSKGEEIPTTASKVHVSYAYRQGEKWEFRIWGWLPCKGKLSNRDAFLNRLHDALQGTDLAAVFGSQTVVPQMTEWHALECSQQDGLVYLQELLGGAQ